MLRDVNPCNSAASTTRHRAFEPTQEHEPTRPIEARVVAGHPAKRAERAALERTPRDSALNDTAAKCAARVQQT